MLRDICVDSGASQQEAEEIIADIRRYAAATEVSAVVERLEDTRVDRLLWPVNGKKLFYSVWLTNLDEVCIVLGILLDTNVQRKQGDDASMTRRYQALVAEPAVRIGMEFDVALDEQRFMELYKRAMSR